MPFYDVDIWSGRGEERWQTQSFSVSAESVEAARRTVAESLGLTPAQWQGNDPPLELLVPWGEPAPAEVRLRQPRSQPYPVREAEPAGLATVPGETVGAWTRLIELLAREAGGTHIAAARKA